MPEKNDEQSFAEMTVCKRSWTDGYGPLSVKKLSLQEDLNFKDSCASFSFILKWS